MHKTANSANTPQTQALGLQGLVAGTMVCTMDGMLPVEYLQTGDRIVTRNGAVPLKSVSVTHHKAALVVRVSANRLGRDRRGADLLIAPDQCIVIRGAAAAVVAASDLVDGELLSFEVLPMAGFFSLAFEADEIIYAEGLELACQRPVAEAA